MSSSIETLDAPPAEYMSVLDVATYTSLSAEFWNRLRSTGGGPPYIKLPRMVRYRRVDIDAWMTERMRSSTFDGPAAGRA
jgi:predicted DNA-binding transcriptional regulator AlpA